MAADRRRVERKGRGRPVPAVVNPASGGAKAALAVLHADPRVRVHEVAPAELALVVADLAARGADRVVLAGGDGTLSGAADALAGRPTARAVVPAGTLNHFARGLGIPTDPRAALEVALGGVPAPADVGAVNGRVFLSTSAVGAYVSYVRGRERLEPWLGYYGASAAAAVQTFARLRGFGVEVEAGGAVRRRHSPLVFVGVGERELRPPRLGERKASGRRGLHVLVVRRTTRLGLLAMAARGLTTGVRPWGAEGEVGSLVVSGCRITPQRRRGRVSVDGEIVPARGALRYEHRRGALAVVIPRPAAGAV